MADRDQINAAANALAASGEVWLTECAGPGGTRLGGSVIAPNLAAAEAIAAGRGMGEAVIGQLVGVREAGE